MLRDNLLRPSLMLCFLTLIYVSTSFGVSYSVSGNAAIVYPGNVSNLNYDVGQPVPVSYSSLQLSPLVPTPVGGTTGTTASSASPSSGLGIPRMTIASLAYTALPDITVAVNQSGTTCNHVSFTVTLNPHPSYPSPEGNQVVRVRVLSDISGTTEAVGETLLVIPASGGSVSATLGFPIPPTVSAARLSDSITVIADPENEIPESDEVNNSMTVLGTCLG